MRKLVRLLLGVAMALTAMFVGFRYGVPMYGELDLRSPVETRVTAPCRNVTVFGTTLYTGCAGSAESTAGNRQDGYVHGATEADLDGSVKAVWVAGAGYTPLSGSEMVLGLATPMLTVIALRLLLGVLIRRRRRRYHGAYSDASSSDSGGSWDGDSGGDSGGGDGGGGD